MTLRTVARLASGTRFGAINSRYPMICRIGTEGVGIAGHSDFVENAAGPVRVSPDDYQEHVGAVDASPCLDFSQSLGRCFFHRPVLEFEVRATPQLSRARWTNPD